MIKIITKSARETQKVAGILAREIAGIRTKHARVVALSGNLGAGKTTFVQGFLKALGVREKIASPTFVILKIYVIRQKTKDKRQRTHHVVHADCYRLQSAKELAPLGFRELLNDPKAIVVIEWAERARRLLPKKALWFCFTHGRKSNERVIRIKK